MSEHGVALFYTTSMALKAEKALSSAGIAIKTIPAPRQFSSDCGIAVRFDWRRADEVRAALERAAVEIAGLHALE